MGPQPPGTCDLERYQDVLWSLRVEVGGRSRRFLLDFGAGVTALDGRVADELGLHERRRVTGVRLTGERLDVPLVEPTDLSIAGTRFTPRSLGRFDFSALLPSDWPPVDGVLALDLLEGHPFAADFAEGRFHLGIEGFSDLVLVPSRLVRQIAGVSLGVFLAVNCPDGEAWFELDNSNTGPVLLSPATAKRLGVEATRSGARVADIHVPGLDPLRTPVVVKDMIYDGNLGMTFVEDRRFAMDLAAGRVRVGPQRR